MWRENSQLLNYGYISMISQSGLQSSNIHMQSHTIQLVSLSCSSIHYNNHSYNYISSQAYFIVMVVWPIGMPPVIIHHACFEWWCTPMHPIKLCFCSDIAKLPHHLLQGCNQLHSHSSSQTIGWFAVIQQCGCCCCSLLPITMYNSPQL